MKELTALAQKMTSQAYKDGELWGSILVLQSLARRAGIKAPDIQSCGFEKSLSLLIARIRKQAVQDAACKPPKIDKPPRRGLYAYIGRDLQKDWFVYLQGDFILVSSWLDLQAVLGPEARLDPDRLYIVRKQL